MWWWAAALAIAILLVVWLVWTAERVDRLHIRVESARARMDSRLLRRSATALEVSTAGILDPAAALLVADAAHQARAVSEAGREQAESDLTLALAAAFRDPVHVRSLRREPWASELLDELSAACEDVELARRFHNDNVRAALRLRRRVRVRIFRLAGHARQPESVEFADTVPRGLA